MNDDARDALATLAALHAARETGILDALFDTADTPSDVAAQTDVDERAANVIVDVLADRGFFDDVDGAYEPTNRALGLLTKTDLRSIGHVPHETNRFERLAALADTITADAAVEPEREPRPDESIRDRLGYEQATPDADVSAAVSVAERAAPDATSVLDLGGAPGRHATEFAARGKRVTLRDTPDCIDAARPLLAPRDVALDPGALTTDLPTADLVFATHLTPRLAPDDLASALAAAHDALTRERADENRTTLVFVEHLRDHSPRTPTHRLEALATHHPGDHHTERTLRDALNDTGFDTADVHAIPGLDTQAITATATTPRST